MKKLKDLKLCDVDENEYVDYTIKKHVPCAEMVRFGSSGLEATMHTIRLARAQTSETKTSLKKT